jgi:hypothetical protein
VFPLAVVGFLWRQAINKRRPKSTTAPVVDPAALDAAEVAAAAMAALLIAEEANQKQALPSKHGNSNKARKQRNRRKTNLDELEAGSEGHNEGLSGKVASSSGMRDGVGERDDMARDGQSHNEPEGCIGRNVQRLGAS